MRTLISVVALFVLFGADVFGAIGSWPKTTTYTRQFLGATNADAARAALGIVATNSDVLTVTETNSTSVTNLVGRIVTSNNIVVGTIGTNLLSQSAYDALVGGGDGGTGDATLAGNNTWTGTNVFTGEFVAGNVGSPNLTWLWQDIPNTSQMLAGAGAGAGQGILNNHTNSVGVGYSSLQGSPGSANSSLGVSSLQESPGSVNSSLGAYSLQGSAGNYNSSLGANSLQFSPGNYNSSLGASSLQESPGNYNSSLGYYSLYQTTGSYNFAGGYYAGEKLNAGSSNVYIGPFSGPANYTSESNKLYIANAPGTPLIGGDFAEKRIDLNGLAVVTNALLIRSNSWTTPPTLSPGDISFLSQDGVPMVVSKDAGGVESTNRLDGVPAGIVTNNHAAAVTFSNNVTVASNLVVQGSSTFGTLNVGELNVTNLAASIIDTTNIISGTITSNDIAAGTIGTNLLSQSAYNALVGGGSGGVVGMTTNVAVLVPGDLTNTLQFYLGVLTNVVAGVVTNEEPAGTDCVTVAMGDEGAVGAASSLARYSTTLEAAYQFAATNNVDICALSILVGTNASPTNLLRLAIRADSDGTPGAVLAQSDYALPVANEWLKIECAASLTNGGIYWITAKSESYNESNYWWWGNVGYGTSGAVTFTDAYGTNWAATNSAQLNFRIYE